MPNMSIKKTILSGLSDRQKEAVTHTEGPLLLIAGPGSGKTRVMAHRVAYLVAVKKIPTNNILAVTFTNKAARELKERCERLVSYQKEFLQVRTFHGFCSRILRFEGENIGLSSDFSIFDEDDQKKVIKRSFEDENIDIKQHSPGKIISVISKLKNSIISPEKFSNEVTNFSEEIISRIFSRYQDILLKSNAVDFDDLLLKTFHLFDENKYILDKYSDLYTYILIDEFQDTNPLQFRVTKLLSDQNRNLCVVGDPDQSIYSWRYADPTNLTEFKKSFPESTTITLDQSYRSTQNILNAANSLINNNSARSDKNLWTNNGSGGKLILYETNSEEDEARIVLNEIKRLNQSEKIPLDEIAIMYRVNAQSRSFEVICNRLAIRYRLIGGVKFYDRLEVKDILAYLRLVSNKSDDTALLRIINTPRRGISDRTVSEIIRLAREEGSTIFEIISLIKEEKIKTNLIPRAIKSISEFVELVNNIFEVSNQMDITDLINFIIDKTEYRSYLRRDEEKSITRLENINELIASSDQYIGLDSDVQLSSFLENLALVSSVDFLETGDQIDSNSEELTLITLHQAKGLEYKVVFLVGCEDGLLPHMMSIGDIEALEEERRICYVGITRAKSHLYFSYSTTRIFRGSFGGQILSRFITEIPEHLIVRKRNMGYSNFHMPENSVSYNKDKLDLKTQKNSRSEKLIFLTGSKVKHDIFGEGIVMKNFGEDGEVLFSNFGIKKLMWNYAPIILLEDQNEINFIDPEIDSA